jgi:diguanylate cyclase (GGDEF)-like protein
MANLTVAALGVSAYIAVIRADAAMLKFQRLYMMIGQPSPVVIWTATAAGLLIQFIVFAAIAFDFYRGTLQSNSDVAESIATLIEQDIARNIELYDLALQAVADSVKDPEVMALPSRLRQMAVFDRTATAPGLGAMVVLDKDGSIALDSLQTPPRAGNFSDREYFKLQRDTPRADGFYISRPFQARLQQGLWSISVSRRLNTPDGKFAGMVSGTLKLDFLQQRLEALALGKLGVASLFRDDGTVLVQNLPGNPNVGADWSKAILFKHLPGHTAGSFSSDSSMDHVARLYAFRRVANLPLVIVAGISRTEVLAPWWFRIELIAAVFAAMAASVIILVAMFNRELRRRIAAERGQAALARQDSLSQLANRLGFDEALWSEWRRALRDRRPLSLLMIDADHFKQFNDHYGHPDGDRVLAAIGAAIRGAIRRPGDIAARYGGEEFAVLMPNTGEEGAIQVAESIRTGVVAMAIPHERNSHGMVTVSVGAATITPGRTSAPEMLVETADRALYIAKSTGRNAVRVDGTNSVTGLNDPPRLRA